VIRALEPVLTVRAKDELATVLVSVLQSIDTARNFLVDIVMDEVKNEGICHLSFLSCQHISLYQFSFNGRFQSRPLLTGSSVDVLPPTCFLGSSELDAFPVTQRKSPHPFLIHHWTPTGRGTAAFVPAV